MKANIQSKRIHIYWIDYEVDMIADNPNGIPAVNIIGYFDRSRTLTIDTYLYHFNSILFAAFTVWVAPCVLALWSFSSVTSTAMTSEAPKAFAICKEEETRKILNFIRHQLTLIQPLQLRSQLPNHLLNPPTLALVECTY